MPEDNVEIMCGVSSGVSETVASLARVVMAAGPLTMGVDAAEVAVEVDGSSDLRL